MAQGFSDFDVFEFSRQFADGGKRKQKTQKHGTKNSAADQGDENEVLEFIIQSYSGRCRLEDLFSYFDYLAPKEIIQRLSPFRRIRIFRNTSDLAESVVFVHSHQLVLCANTSHCRDGDECKFLHLCTNFVCGECRFGSRCRYSHDVRDSHNGPRVMECDLEGMCDDDDVLLELVRYSNLSVCSAHNATDGPQCLDPDVCLKLHVCIEFLHNKCLLDKSSCEHGHDLYEERNKALINLYGMLRGQINEQKENFMRKRILKPSITKGSNATRAPTRNKPPSRWKSSEAFIPHVESNSSCHWPTLSVATQVQTFPGVPSSLSTDSCGMFEKHLCSNISECTVQHGAADYLWRVSIGQSWNDLDDSSAIEKAFCDPQNTIFHTTYVKVIDITINFETMECDLGPIQRLSTPSYVISRNKSDATHWCWYWNDGDVHHKMWLRYDDSSPPYQDVLESKFQFDKTRTLCFETDQSRYFINFERMRQVNMKTGFERELRRRPVLIPIGLKRSAVHFHYDSSKLPQTWVPMNTETDGWTDLIPVDEHHPATKKSYAIVTTQFHSTLPANEFVIKNVFHIQNLDLWKKYQEKKRKMEKRGAVRENNLFHGTIDEKTVRCICHQNFDHRMHGVHGTVYGKGAYFASTSKYSHQYTKPIPSTGNRCMFYARVLVGKSAKGESRYQRPPPLDPAHEHLGLYDSCVDDESNPKIFVVFSDDQCYPEFLIEYKELRPSIVERPQRPTSMFVQGPTPVFQVASPTHVSHRSGIPQSAASGIATSPYAASGGATSPYATSTVQHNTPQTSAWQRGSVHSTSSTSLSSPQTPSRAASRNPAPTPSANASIKSRERSCNVM